MGIRFYCPNGHKLNVKEFQAGRRGICPYCGAKIQIPTHSTRGSTHEPAGRGDAGAEQTIVTQPVQDMAAPLPGYGAAAAAPTWPSGSATMAAPTATAATFPTPQPAPTFAPVEPFAAPMPAAAGGFAAAPQSLAGATMTGGGFAAAPAGPTEFAATAPTISAPAPVPEPAASAPPAPAAASAAPDPLVEAGDAVWYVRPTSGGQFGPANATVVRQWLGEGRIPVDALVWREGWRDWQQAGDVFPQLRGSPNPLASIGITPSTGLGAATSAGHRPAARSNPRTFQIAIVAILVLAVIVLLGVFIYVLSSSSQKSSRQRRSNGATIAAVNHNGQPLRMSDLRTS